MSEFDEITAELDSEKYEHDVYMADPDGVSSHPGKHWVDGRRYQHSQDAKRIAELENDLHLSKSHHSHVSSRYLDLQDKLKAAEELIGKLEEKLKAYSPRAVALELIKEWKSKSP